MVHKESSPPVPTATDTAAAAATVDKPETKPEPVEANVTVITLNQEEVEDESVAKASQPQFPLLPKPPSRENRTRVPKPTYNNILQPTQAPPPPQVKPDIEKSKSLPRGHQAWPQEEPEEVDGHVDEEARLVEQLQLELLKLKFENEELEALKSELEWRKRSERKEMEELREEMATMQTLYQYRTYSVDSSESSSDEHSNDVEETEELRRKLTSLIRENQELEEKRMALCEKIQEERSACIQLRVEIKVEQERIGMKKAACWQIYRALSIFTCVLLSSCIVPFLIIVVRICLPFPTFLLVFVVS